MTIELAIKEKLLKAFSPLHLDVVNESNQHSLAPDGESHFKVTIVSKEFENERLIKRHRAVNSVLALELAENIHALALHTYTEKEWQADSTNHAPLSPKCLGGSK